MSVQIAQKRRGHREIVEHVGSAHSDTEVALLKSVAWRKIAGEEQPELDLGLNETTGTAGPARSGVKITGLRMGPLIDAPADDPCSLRLSLRQTAHRDGHAHSLRVESSTAGHGPVAHTSVRRVIIAARIPIDSLP